MSEEVCIRVSCFVFFFKQKTAYEMRISDWSSDVCSSDLLFLAIAERSANSEIVASIAAIGDRLQLSRHFDAMILADIDAEYNAIAKIGRASCRERVCQYV